MRSISPNTYIVTFLAIVVLTLIIRTQMSYNPFPNGIKIMPLGDSITDGYNVIGGYRTELWRLFVEGGYEINFVGSLTSGPRELPDKNHEGHSGWQISQIHKRIEGWLRRTEPDIIFLLIGTNDIGRNDGVETAPDRLEALVEDIFKQVPNVTLFVGSIPPIDPPSVNERVRDYNREIASLVNRHDRAGDRIFFVDIYTALTVGDLADGLHPNPEGHRKIARTWYDAMSSILAS